MTFFSPPLFPHFTCQGLLVADNFFGEKIMDAMIYLYIYVFFYVLVGIFFIDFILGFVNNTFYNIAKYHEKLLKKIKIIKAI